ncbi:fibulin-7-like isoform X1 [Astyanax mexicanus]|uniref:fibulin-7-like isoform X1 n=2 Tax=Astyanax mexicanus TaxID=7994 RepID=UPI0020CB09E0|nr:fibulin-7-like isoform X1 [Astyanax mexicanus]
MYRGLVLWGIFLWGQVLRSESQDCVNRQELQSTLRQVNKLLLAHETSFLQNVRSLRKKLSLLQSSMAKPSNNTTTGKNRASCPPPELLANGKMLGRVFRVGHEVHFLCNAGFELTGAETRVCQDSLTWSGEHAACKATDAGINNDGTSSMPTSPSSSPLISTYVRPSRCIEFQGSKHCTCEQGYSIYSQDRGLCTDIDECALSRLTQPGRLCLHTCVNTAGSFRCECPRGYALSRDSRNCQDIDECEGGFHNCTGEQVCVNTFGGHRCVEVECPRFRNASYVKTSPQRCERNPCLEGDKACLQAPVSVNFHFMSVVSNMTAPRVLFRVSAARVLGDTLRFGLLGNRGTAHFAVQRSGKQTGQLLLVDPVQGPATLEAEVEMSELQKRTLLGRYVTKVTLFVSPYTF